MKTISIIGTAGRKEDLFKLTKRHYNAMYDSACKVIASFVELNNDDYCLVSGGAAWADHVAVSLFLTNRSRNLRLYLPCQWDGNKFYDTGVYDYISNPGGTANFYHKKFQQNTGINSLDEISKAKSLGAELIVEAGGFFARNSFVAKSDWILAMTFGDRNKVKDGGTADTVGKYLRRIEREKLPNNSWHYDIGLGQLFKMCKV